MGRASAGTAWKRAHGVREPEAWTMREDAGDALSIVSEPRRGASTPRAEVARADGVPTSFRHLLELVREDCDTMKRSLTRPGLHAIVVYRFGSWMQTQPAPARLVGGPVYMVLQNLVRLVYSIQLPLTAEIGRRILISHFGHVFVGDYVRIGDDCLIRHNVTIGGRDRGRSREAATLEAGVRVGAGAVISGALTVGPGAKIGPNAVVFNDVPPGSRVLAPQVEVRPAKNHQGATGTALAAD